MRTRIARMLRRAANRLDPPRYWGNVMRPTAATSSTTARIVRIHTGPEPPTVTDAIRRGESA